MNLLLENLRNEYFLAVSKKSPQKGGGVKAVKERYREIFPERVKKKIIHGDKSPQTGSDEGSSPAVD